MPDPLLYFVRLSLERGDDVSDNNVVLERFLEMYPNENPVAAAERLDGVVQYAAYLQFGADFHWD